MKVLKFGGTSVGSPERMKKLFSIIETQPSDKQVIVLSAVSGTTNSLESISKHYLKGNKQEALDEIAQMYKQYQSFIVELFESGQGLEDAKELILHHFELLKDLANDIFTHVEQRIVLAQGELLSTALFHYYLKAQGVDSVLLPALDFMRLDSDQEPDYSYMTLNLQQIMDTYSEQVLFITQGYICRNHFGEVDNLRRGGSDYTASLIGAVLQAQEIQIWTDIDGFHNNDPRCVSNTKAIEQLSFDEAAELAYFGAKILHPQSVFPAKKYNVPVRLLDTLLPQAKGTLISETTQSDGKIVAIAAKDGITAIRINSSRMLLAHGFLRRVFEVFERYKVPIDMITTSEVAVSLTIDQVEHLDQIVSDLEHFGKVDIDSNQSIVCVVGDFKTNTHGHATIVSEAVKHIPVRMISYGGSEHNLSLLVPEQYKVETLRSLHNRIF